MYSGPSLVGGDDEIIDKWFFDDDQDKAIDADQIQLLVDDIDKVIDELKDDDLLKEKIKNFKINFRSEIHTLKTNNQYSADAIIGWTKKYFEEKKLDWKLMETRLARRVPYLYFKLNEQKISQFKKDLRFITQTLKTNNRFTEYALINWAEMYCAEQELDWVLMQTRLTRGLGFVAKYFDKGMTGAYLLLNLFGFLVAISKFTNGDFATFLQDETLNTKLAIGWNYWDATGGYAGMIKQGWQGERTLCLANFVNSSQLTICTKLAHFGGYSAQTAANLVAFSFAICMLMSCCAELYEADKCEQRIKVYQESLESLSPLWHLKNDEKEKFEVQQQIILLQKSIIFEKAQAENHYRCAISWAGCAVAMTLIALGVSTMGTGLVAAVIIAGFALVTGIVRARWVKNVDYIEEATKRLNPQLQEKKVDEDKNLEEKPLLKQLNEVMAENKDIPFNKVVTIPGKLMFTSSQITLHSYLLNLFVTDPDKLQTIIKILNPKHKKNTSSRKMQLQKELSNSRRGYYICQRLFSPMGSDPKTRQVSKESDILASSTGMWANSAVAAHPGNTAWSTNESTSSQLVHAK